MRLKSKLYTATILAGGLLLTGCSSPAITSGVVTDKSFTPAYSYETTECARTKSEPAYEYGFDPISGKYKYRWTTKTSCAEYQQVTHNVPDTWTVSITDPKDSEKSATYPVTEEIFDQASKGYLYDSETNTLTAK